MESKVQRLMQDYASAEANARYDYSRIPLADQAFKELQQEVAELEIQANGKLMESSVYQNAVKACAGYAKTLSQVDRDAEEVGKLIWQELRGWQSRLVLSVAIDGCGDKVFIVHSFDRKKKVALDNLNEALRAVQQ